MPAYYEFLNLDASLHSPSTVHVRNTNLQAYLRKYLLERLMSIFKYTLPSNWSKNYFLYTLYPIGWLSVINTDKFGRIPQLCGLMGINVFYEPRQAIIVNPLLAGIKEPIIGKECEIIKLQPNYSSVMDIVNYYADKLAIAWEAADMNLINSKLAYVFFAKNKAVAETFKKLYDWVAEGNPAAVIDKQLADKDGKPTWNFLSQDLKNNYITSDILSDINKIMKMFDTEIGIPNANTEKKERLIVPEVKANKQEVFSKSALWFETVSECFEKVRKMFHYSPEELKVEWRFKGDETNADDLVNTSAV